MQRNQEASTNDYSPNIMTYIVRLATQRDGQFIWRIEGQRRRGIIPVTILRHQ